MQKVGLANDMSWIKARCKIRLFYRLQAADDKTSITPQIVQTTNGHHDNQLQIRRRFFTAILNSVGVLHLFGDRDVCELGGPPFLRETAGSLVLIAIVYASPIAPLDW